MSSNAGGLQRRRVAGGGGGSGGGGGGGSGVGSTSSPPSTSTNGNSSTGTPSNSISSSSNPLNRLDPGSASVSGRNSPLPNGDSSSGSHHKIAYDPRDLETSDEERSHPKLTLMEEVLLLGLKDKQGYLSFWNDNISYTLRGCIVLELALRHKIAMVKDSNRRRFPLPDRFIEVVDEKLTGEVLLDEALKMMKASEKMSVGTWIDLMSGETWNVMKIGYQLKQVRERLAKGLVDKGVLRTEKRNFLLFDMATHPVSDPQFKEDVLRRTLTLLTARTASVPATELYPAEVKYRTVRAISMVCAAFAANVLENALIHLSYDARELAFSKCDELLGAFSVWPFASVGTGSGTGSGVNGATAVGEGSVDVDGANLNEINRVARSEVDSGKELNLEVVAAVLQVFGKMDSLL